MRSPLLKILPMIITTWYYTFPLGSMIQDIKSNFPWYIKSQHLTSSTKISPACSNISALGVDLKCLVCITVEKSWNILCLGVSNQQPDLAIVTSVGIFDNFQRMSISNHREVMEVIMFGGGGAPTITFNGVWKISKMYRIIYDKSSENIAVIV